MSQTGTDLTPISGQTNGHSTEINGCLSAKKRSIGVKDLNEWISCHLCNGYLIDATTVIECLHSFCKTCILNHLDSNTPKSRFCPHCDIQIHKTKPKLNIRSDPTLQDIVYKLVPGLYKNEMNRRKEFYSKEPESAVGLSNEEKGEMSGERLIFTPEDSIYLAIEYFPQVISYGLLPFNKNLSNGSLNVEPTISATGQVTKSKSQRRYLICEGGMRVFHLKKWLKGKYGIKEQYDIEILYKHDPLLDEYTMIDLAYIYSWRRNGPLCLYYKIIEPQKKTKDESKQLRAPVAVVKRQHTVKHKPKKIKKQKPIINESNLITTNPVNEPLPPVDSSLINKVMFANKDSSSIPLNNCASSIFDFNTIDPNQTRQLFQNYKISASPLDLSFAKKVVPSQTPKQMSVSKTLTQKPTVSRKNNLNNQTSVPKPSAVPMNKDSGNDFLLLNGKNKSVTPSVSKQKSVTNLTVPKQIGVKTPVPKSTAPKTCVSRKNGINNETTFKKPVIPRKNGLNNELPVHKPTSPKPTVAKPPAPKPVPQTTNLGNELSVYFALPLLPSPKEGVHPIAPKTIEMCGFNVNSKSLSPLTPTGDVWPQSTPTTKI